MPHLEINPRFRDLLAGLGLSSAEQFLSLPGLIVSGHLDRHVARVALGGAAAYLKREHRVRPRDRLAAAGAGFGLVSKSLREARVLAALRRAGVGAPDWVAAGEDGRGRAFLLLEDLPGAVDLREYLRGATPEGRRQLARRLGSALASVHGAGFDHPDLYAKHVLVDPATQAIRFLDWQRTRRRLFVGRRRRARDLAALDATLADEFATGRERLACLRAYVRASAVDPPPGLAKWLARAVRARAARLLRTRHVRKERAAPPPVAARGVRWLDGEALCVTQEFWEELGGAVPAWLPLPAASPEGSSRSEVALAGGRRGLLVRRRCSRPLAWLWSALRGRSLVTEEVRQAGVLFARLKHGQDGPRVLAFGQRRPRPWRTESFLLTEAAAGGERGTA